MASVHRRSRNRRYLTPLEWPSTPEIDGYVWNLAPAAEDARWAAENLNSDWHDEVPTPPEVLDEQAAEAEALDRHERGYCC